MHFKETVSDCMGTLKCKVAFALTCTVLVRIIKPLSPHILVALLISPFSNMRTCFKMNQYIFFMNSARVKDAGLLRIGTLMTQFRGTRLRVCTLKHHFYHNRPDRYLSGIFLCCLKYAIKYFVATHTKIPLSL